VESFERWRDSVVEERQTKAMMQRLMRRALAEGFGAFVCRLDEAHEERIFEMERAGDRMLMDQLLREKLLMLASCNAARQTLVHLRAAAKEQIELMLTGLEGTERRLDQVLCELKGNGAVGGAGCGSRKAAGAQV
jgi:hypothetical protein